MCHPISRSHTLSFYFLLSYILSHANFLPFFITCHNKTPFAPHLFSCTTIPHSIRNPKPLQTLDAHSLFYKHSLNASSQKASSQCPKSPLQAAAPLSLSFSLLHKSSGGTNSSNSSFSSLPPSHSSIDPFSTSQEV